MSMHHALLAQQMANPAPGGGEWGDWVHYWGMTDFSGTTAPDRIGGLDQTLTSPVLETLGGVEGVRCDKGTGAIPAIFTGDTSTPMTLVMSFAISQSGGSTISCGSQNLPIGVWHSSNNFLQFRKPDGQFQGADLVNGLNLLNILAISRGPTHGHRGWTCNTGYDVRSIDIDGIASLGAGQTAFQLNVYASGSGGEGRAVIHWLGVMSKEITEAELQDLFDNGRPFQ